MASRGHAEWMEQAVCAGIGGDLWFADPNSIDARDAINICKTCPSQTPCTEEAINMISTGFPIFGIWGGLPAKDLEYLSQERHGKVKRRSAT